MIAVAKGLLSGLETAVASTTKKDGNTPPFADTFQQVSANQASQATKAVTQRAVRADRASSGGKKASGASTIVDSAEQAANASSSGSASAAKADGKALTPAGSVADRKNAGGAEQQIGADVERQVKPVQIAETQPSVDSAGGTGFESE